MTTTFPRAASRQPGMTNTHGTIRFGVLMGVRAVRIRVCPNGTTLVRLVDDKGAYRAGDEVILAPGEFVRDGK